MNEARKRELIYRFFVLMEIAHGSINSGVKLNFNRLCPKWGGEIRATLIHRNIIKCVDKRFMRYIWLAPPPTMFMAKMVFKSWYRKDYTYKDTQETIEIALKKSFRNKVLGFPVSPKIKDILIEYAHDQAAI